MNPGSEYIYACIYLYQIWHKVASAAVWSWISVDSDSLILHVVFESLMTRPTSTMIDSSTRDPFILYTDFLLQVNSYIYN